MWHSLGERHVSSDEWDAALERQSADIPPAAAVAASNCVVACKSLHELLVGGDDSPCLIQVLSATDEGGNDDMLASVLLPEDDVRVAFSARGTGVLRLLASFWIYRPSAPVVIPSHGTYTPLLCRLPDKDWTVGVLSAAHVQRLQMQTCQFIRVHMQYMQMQ